MPRPRRDVVQVAVRIPKLWAVECDRIARAASDSGRWMTRADVIREAISEGLEAFKVSAATKS